MTKEQFEKFYKKELTDFKNNVLNDKEAIKTDIRDRLRSDGYNEMLNIREEEFGSDIKKNSMKS
jgi:hypothetical protein